MSSSEEELKTRMILLAKNLHGEILLAGLMKSFDESFTSHDGNILFWFNTQDNSTRVISSKCLLEEKMK